MKIKLTCPICKSEFYRYKSYINNHPHAKLTCSMDCYKKYYVGENSNYWKGGINNIEHSCKYCNKIFFGRKDRKYCSVKCSQLDSVGRTINKTGKRLSVICYWCGKKFSRLECNLPNRYKHTFCSKSCKYKWMEKNYSGENNWRWIKDRDKLKSPNKLRKLIEMTNWRNYIFERDNYTCQLCGTNKSPFNAHHIKKLDCYPELAFYVNNGITLCESCHKIVTWNEIVYEELFEYIVAYKGINEIRARLGYKPIDGGDELITGEVNTPAIQPPG